MIEASTLWELVTLRAEATPEGLFALDEAGRELTFEGLRSEAEKVAAGLHAQGVREGDPVSWVLPTRIDGFVLMVALARIGAVQNPLVPIYRTREVTFCLDQTQARWFITRGVLRGFDFGALGRELAASSKRLETIDIEPGLPTADPAALPVFHQVGHSEEPSDEHVRWIFYTSGTTSDPKGARHTDRAVLLSSRGLASAIRLEPDAKTGVVFPITHLGGANALVSTLFAGSTQLVIEQFDPVTSIPFLARHGVTHAGAGPVFYQVYLEAQRAAGPEPIFPLLRVLYGGGAPSPVGMDAAVRRELGGIGILSTYGMTECPLISMVRWGDSEQQRSTTCGLPTQSETRFRIVDHAGQDVSTGEEGEIRVDAPQLLRGYVDEKLNEEAFDEQGFFRTGDLGRLDDQGYVALTGRIKDVIIRKGENISAPEIEGVLVEHPRVAEVAVIGLPDPERGERVCAIVRGTPGAERLGFDEMVSFLADRGLMQQKLPEQLEYIDEMPHNPSGKIVKAKLKERFKENSAS
jgi:cyclohexanecarboxylate-CoA ligase